MNPVYFCETMEGEEAPLELEAGPNGPAGPPLIGPDSRHFFLTFSHANGVSKNPDVSCIYICCLNKSIRTPHNSPYK